MIGEKHMWGQGYGSDTISVLTRFGFEDEGVDLIFACGVADYNPRSRRAFEKIGYTVDQCIENQPGTKARYEYDLILSIGDYLKQKNAERDQVAGEAGRAADGSR